MSGTIVNTYSQPDSDVLNIQLTLDATRIGYHQVSLTNYDNTSESEIAAGSYIEVGGALYKFESNEAITGSPSDGTVYIYIVPAGATCTAAYTNTAPTWDDSKQGWYGTNGTANSRYLEFTMELNSTVWTLKRKELDINRLIPFYNYFHASNPDPVGSYTFSTAQGVSIENTYAAIDYDVYSQYDAGKIYIPKDGFYEIILSYSTSILVTGIFTGKLWSNLVATIQKNGSTTVGTSGSTSNYAAGTTSGSDIILIAKLYYSKVLEFVAGDYIKIFMTYDTGCTNTLGTTFTYHDDSCMSMRKIDM